MKPKLNQLGIFTNLRIFKKSILFLWTLVLISFTTQIFAITPPDTTALNHIAIIADGNRRWAKENGLKTTEGHVKGITIVAPQIFEDLFSLDVHTVTLWCCSLNNLEREKSEVENFLSCFEVMINKMMLIASERQIRIVHLGRKDLLPKSLCEALINAEEATRSHTAHVLNLAIAYDGNDEICRAFTKLLTTHDNINKINPQMLSEALDTAGQPFPNPDLIIRAAGEQRLSGFMPFQSQLSELYFTKVYFPALHHEDLIKAIREFGERNRTYGK